MRKWWTVLCCMSLSLTLHAQEVKDDGTAVAEGTTKEEYNKPEVVALLSAQEEVTRATSQVLRLAANDLRIVSVPNTQYIDLIIKKGPQTESVMLTNYYWVEDKGRVREYGLRIDSGNEVNGSERRLYNTTFIGGTQGLYFLIDSTPENDPSFGMAFRIRIPAYVLYGYEDMDEVYGMIRIAPSVRLNVRTFTKKYGDYSGYFYDNPIVLLGKDATQGQPFGSYGSHLMTGVGYPVISKVGEVHDPELFSVRIRFEGVQSLLNSFLIRKSNQELYKTIPFHNAFPKPLNALLLSVSYNNPEHKSLEALMYFPYTGKPQVYYIVAVDSAGVYSSNRVIVEVPAGYVQCKEVPCAPEEACVDDKECYHYRLQKKQNMP